MTQTPEHQGGAFGFVRNAGNRVQAQDLTTAEVENAAVQGPDGEALGTIRALKLGTDGRITDAVIDVGGFLGLGVHTVVVPFIDLMVLRVQDGPALRIELDTTADHLRALPRHEG